MSLEVCMDSRRRWVSARKWYNQGLLIHIETTYSSGSPWAQNRLILREYFYSFLSICLWPMLELMQTHCYWILSMSDSDALTLQPQTVRKEKGCWMRWTFGLTQHSHFSVLLRPALTKFRTTFKCLLNTFKTGLDICMSSALSMSLSLTVHVCIYFFFLNRSAFEICISANRSQNWNIPTGKSRPWSLGQKGAKVLFLQLEARYLCNYFKWIFYNGISFHVRYILQRLPR